MTAAVSGGDRGLVTYAEAARVCDVTESTVRDWRRRYGIPAVVIDGRVWLSEVAVLECERARRRSGRRRRTPRRVVAEPGADVRH